MTDAAVPRPAEAAAPRKGQSVGWFRRSLDSDIFYSFRRSRMTMAWSYNATAPWLSPKALTAIALSW